MAALILRELTNDDEQAFFEGLKEWEGQDLTWYTFAWKPGMSYREMLDTLSQEKLGINLPEGRVPTSILYAFVDDKIVGRVSIRHYLNERLSFRGGHVGYAVAPRFRGLGYATEIFRQSLPVCASLGIKDILVTCNDSNVASWKIIEKFGGELRDKVFDDQEKVTVRRYWIEL